MEVTTMAPPKKMKRMRVTELTPAVLMIVFGALVIAFPNLIAWLVGIYLIIVGAVNLFDHMYSVMDSAKSSET
jgi:uncharacterized membrane protein HdeD (DUF308 family)